MSEPLRYQSALLSHCSSPNSIHERSGREKIFSSNVAHGEQKAEDVEEVD